MRRGYHQTGVETTILMLLALSVGSWVFVIWSVANTDHPVVRLMMPMTSSWTAKEAIFVWIMWAVMMGAMMLPSAAPMVLTHRKIAGRKGLPWDGVVFVGGYLVIWGGFSAVATGFQWWLQQVGQLSHMLITTESETAGIILVTAGVNQWTPFKDMCLAKCRTPIGFLTTDWREGPYGALIMGLRHGAYCVGCCWALMALLFAFGVMNLAAIGVLSCMVAAEKLLPRGDVIAGIGGIGLTIWGAWLLVS